MQGIILPFKQINHSIKKFIIDLARELRRNQTPQEGLLWQKLRNRKLSGLKFLRQHPIIFGGTEYKPEFFIMDFYCAERKLVIEVDGKIHDFQKSYDRDRDAILGKLGLRVLRIKNEELGDVKAILNTIQQLTHPLPPLYKVERGVRPRWLSGDGRGESRK